MKFIGTKQIETERLILRKLTVNDAEEAYNNWCSSYCLSNCFWRETFKTELWQNKIIYRNLQFCFSTQFV